MAAPFQVYQCFNWLTPRLVAISHHPPRLLFTAWPSTEHWTRCSKPSRLQYLGTDHVENIVPLLLYQFCFRVCLGSHVIVTYPLYWGAGGCLAKAVCLVCLLRNCCLERNVVSEPFISNGCFSLSTVLALNRYATISYIPHPLRNIGETKDFLGMGKNEVNKDTTIFVK
jgi:hypothetical protein